MKLQGLLWTLRWHVSCREGLLAVPAALCGRFVAQRWFCAWTALVGWSGCTHATAVQNVLRDIPIVLVLQLLADVEGPRGIITDEDAITL